MAEAATGPGSDPGPGAYTTETVTVTRTGGPPATSVTTVHMTPAHNATAAGYPYSSGAVASTALVEVSRAASKPHPGGWRGGSVTLGCLVMLLAVVSLSRARSDFSHSSAVERGPGAWARRLACVRFVFWLSAEARRA